MNPISWVHLYVVSIYHIIYTYVYIKIYKDYLKFFTDSFGLNINNENASSL